METQTSPAENDDDCICDMVRQSCIQSGSFVPHLTGKVQSRIGQKMSRVGETDVEAGQQI